MSEPRAVAITGASSGIGAALARAFAAPDRLLALGGRDRVRLEQVGRSCRARGAEVDLDLHDVRERAAMAAWIDRIDQKRPLDLLIANAGIDGSGLDWGEQPYAVFAVNVEGVFNTVLPALVHMRRRRRGQVAIVSSLAGFRGIPGAVAYSASKAAVRAFGEALRGRLLGEGVAVSVICPGFVESGITAGNRFPMPFLLSADEAAARIVRGLASGRGRIAFPWPMYAAVWLMGALPQRLVDAALARAPRKT